MVERNVVLGELCSVHGLPRRVLQAQTYGFTTMMEASPRLNNLVGRPGRCNGLDRPGSIEFACQVDPAGSQCHRVSGREIAGADIRWLILSLRTQIIDMRSARPGTVRGGGGGGGRSGASISGGAPSLSYGPSCGSHCGGTESAMLHMSPLRSVRRNGTIKSNSILSLVLFAVLLTGCAAREARQAALARRTPMSQAPGPARRPGTEILSNHVDAQPTGTEVTGMMNIGGRPDLSGRVNGAIEGEPARPVAEESSPVRRDLGPARQHDD